MTWEEAIKSAQEGYYMKKGKLYTSYFAKLKYGKGLKISIARYNPKWLSNKYIDKWFQELAPNRYLLNKYKYENLSWKEYEELYKKDLFNSINYSSSLSVLKLNSASQSQLLQ